MLLLVWERGLGRQLPARVQINESPQKEKLSLTSDFEFESTFKFSHANDLNPLTLSVGVPSFLPDRERGIFTSSKVFKPL